MESAQARVTLRREDRVICHSIDRTHLPVFTRLMSASRLLSLRTSYLALEVCVQGGFGEGGFGEGGSTDLYWKESSPYSSVSRSTFGLLFSMSCAAVSGNEQAADCQ